MAIYTRTGDAGTVALFTGQRASRTHSCVEAYDALDELSTALSLHVCAAKTPQHRQLLGSIQLQLFWFSAELASESEEPTPEQHYVNSKEIAALETATDTTMGGVPPLRNFILPGHRETASQLHLARTLARRAERRPVKLPTEISVRHVLMCYINRLPDCLYALARAGDHDVHQNDIIQKVTERYPAAAQTPAIKEPAISLSFQGLHQLTRVAAIGMEEPQVPVVISIVDTNGTQMVTQRMPNALLVSSELAPKKAWTAVATRTATHELTSAIQPDAALYGLENHMQGKVVTFSGGYALWREGLLLRGLSISGESVEQDMDITETTIAAISVRTRQ